MAILYYLVLRICFFTAKQGPMKNAFMSDFWCRDISPFWNARAFFQWQTQDIHEVVKQGQTFYHLKKKHKKNTFLIDWDLMHLLLEFLGTFGYMFNIYS